MCVCRDSLLASLLDGVRASGNRDVCVKMAPTRRGQRWGLLSMPVDEEVESLHLKFLAAPPSELVGWFATSVHKKIFQLLDGLTLKYRHHSLYPEDESY